MMLENNNRDLNNTIGFTAIQFGEYGGEEYHIVRIVFIHPDKRCSLEEVLCMTGEELFTSGGASSLIGNAFHREFGILTLIKAYTGKYSRVIIESNESDKWDMTCFTKSSNHYTSCSDKCKLGIIQQCENWQIKSKPADGFWGSSDIEKLFTDVSAECTEAIPKLALEGRFKPIANRDYGGNPNITSLYDFDHIETLKNNELLQGGFIFHGLDEVKQNFGHFFNKHLMANKTINVTSENIQKELIFKPELFQIVPSNIKNEENVFIPNITIDKNRINVIERENCTINEIFLNDMIETDKILSSSLIIVYKNSSGLVDRLFTLLNNPKSKVKMIIAPSDININLKSRGLEGKLHFIAKKSSFTKKQFLEDFSTYQGLWRYIHGGG